MPFIPFSILLTIVVIATASTGTKAWNLWGFNHIAYFPPAIRVLLVALCLVSVVPSVRRRGNAVVSRIGRWLFDPKSNGWAASIVAVAGFTLLCFVFRSSTQLWGDGEAMAMIAEKAAKVGSSTVEALRLAVDSDPLAPGVAALHASIARLGASAGLEVRWTLGSFYALLGGLWMLIVTRRLRRATLDETTRLLLWILLLTSGSIVLFFGYIEDYGLLLVASSFLALYGLDDRDKRWSRVMLVVLGAILVVLDLLSVLMLPAVFYLLLTRGTSGRRRLLITGLVVAAVTCAGAVAMYFIGGAGVHYRPLVGHWRAILTTRFWASLLNLLAILVPAFLVLLAAAFAAPRSTEQSGSKTMTLRVRMFCWVGFVPFLIFLVFFKPDLGMVRDWDIYAASAPFLILSVVPSLAGKKLLRNWIFPIAVVGLVQTSAWIGVNAHEPWSVARYTSTLERDYSHLGYAYEIYAKYLESRGERQEACTAWRHAHQADGNPRYAFNVGMCAAEMGRMDEAIAWMDRVLQHDPSDTKARVNLASFLASKGDFPRLIEVAREGLEYEPKNPYYNVFIGMALYETGQYEEALRQLTLCEELALTPPMRVNVEKAIDLIREKEGQR